jgi:DNA mismatch endonuclease, patch repair protein
MGQDQASPDVAVENPPASSQAARATMRANRGRDTGPELAVRRALHARGLRYRVDHPLPFDRRRRADIAFTRAKVAVFIDGCFWHGCPEHGTTPRTNTAFWAAKIARNRERDEDTTDRLDALGWTVLRFWEHEDAGRSAEIVARTVAQRLSAR